MNTCPACQESAAGVSLWVSPGNLPLSALGSFQALRPRHSATELFKSNRSLKANSAWASVQKEQCNPNQCPIVVATSVNKLSLASFVWALQNPVHTQRWLPADGPSLKKVMIMIFFFPYLVNPQIHKICLRETRKRLFRHRSRPAVLAPGEGDLRWVKA